MTFVVGAVAFISVGVLYLTLGLLGYYQRLRPSALLMLILFVEFGPFFLVDVRHSSSLDPGYSFGILNFGSQIALYVYASLSVAFLGIAAGYTAVHLMASRSSLVRYGEEAVSAQSVDEAEIIRQFYVLLVGIAIVTCGLLLCISAIRQQVAFFGHLATGRVGPGDYEMMRKAILPEDPFSSFLVRLRLNYSLPIGAALTACSVQLKRPYIERIVVIGVFSVIALAALHKQLSAIAALVIVISAYMASNGGTLPKLRALLWPALILAVTAIFFLFVLFRLQYAGNPNVQTADIFRVMYFRVFQANGIDLDLFFLFYKHAIFAKGQTTSLVLARLFDKDVFDPNSYIPQSYGAVTSFPTIFFGGPWVDFGWTGIALSSIMVGGIAALADFIASTLRFAPIRVAYTACSMFALNYFAELQFLTCLLTYGVVVQMVLFITADYSLWRYSRARRLSFAQ